MTMDELEQACEQVAAESLDTVMAREQFRLLRRLVEAVRPSDQPDPIKAKLESLAQSAQAYLGVQWDEDKAPEVMAAAPLARDLLSLRWELEDEQVTTDLEQASAAIQVQVEQLAQKHGPMICQTAIKQRVLQLLRAEDESLHLVLASLRLAVQLWIPFDDHDTSSRKGVLSDHLQAEQDVAGVLAKMISMVWQQTGGAA
jgi:hypothetical protein